MRIWTNRFSWALFSAQTKEFTADPVEICIRMELHFVSRRSAGFEGSHIVWMVLWDRLYQIRNEIRSVLTAYVEVHVQLGNKIIFQSVFDRNILLRVISFVPKYH